MLTLLWTLVLVDFVLCGRDWWRYIGAEIRFARKHQALRAAQLQGAKPLPIQRENRDSSQLLRAILHCLAFWVLFAVVLSTSASGLFASQ